MIKKPKARYRFKWALQNKDGLYYSKTSEWTDDLSNVSIHHCQDSTIQKILSNVQSAVRAIELEVRGSTIRIAKSPLIVYKKE